MGFSDDILMTEFSKLSIEYRHFYGFVELLGSFCSSVMNGPSTLLWKNFHTQDTFMLSFHSASILSLTVMSLSYFLLH